MTLEYIRKTYNVPANPGQRVRFTGNPVPVLGTIKGVDGGYLMILLDGKKFALPFHPTWELEYLEGK